MTDARPSTLRRDLLAAYAAAGAKVASWAVVSAALFRAGGADVLGVLALLRGTIGLLSYTTLGVAPALIHGATAWTLRRRVLPIEQPSDTGVTDGQPPILNYGRPDPPRRVPIDPVTAVYHHAILIGILAALIGTAALWYYADSIERIHFIPRWMNWRMVGEAAFALGLGFMFRVLSEIPGGASAVRNRMAMDQTLVAAADLTWCILVVITTADSHGVRVLALAGETYVWTGGLLLFGRFILARVSDQVGLFPLEIFNHLDFATLTKLLAYGSLLTVAQLADFLYAPTSMILINRLISPEAVATYTPAIQIDAALLLLVGGLANVVLPRAALAHAAGDVAQLKRDYVRGTLASAAMLVGGAMFVLVISPLLFKAWFNDPLPATQAILPLILVHTVVGGSSAVGRSILLGMGKVKAFTAAALIAGVMNVVLSYSFVTYFGMGLNGVVLGTIVVVVARCAVWMPWYVWRVLGNFQSQKPRTR